MRSTGAVRVALCLVALLSACSVEASIQLQLLTAGLDRPVAITHAGDGTGRLFISEQGGAIRIHDGSQLLPTPFLDISSIVSCCGERGLLSAAFHPQYATNGFFYVFYTDLAGSAVVARYHVSANSNIADSTSALIVLNVPQPYNNHNGGQLQFGPDGYLYIGLGDGGSGGDPQNNAQNLGTLLGKLLRIDVDGGTPFAIPPTNPFVGNPAARDEIWAYGLRNPWRFSFDRATGDLFIGDVGEGTFEEIDFQVAGSAGGLNYGWRLMEGSQCFNPSSNCNSGQLTLPILEYTHALGCSVTGGYRYRGALNASEVGTYFYADYCSGRIWGATPDGSGGWTATERVDANLSFSAFGEDEAGELLIAHHESGSGGAIFRLANPSPPPPTRTLTISRTGNGSGTVTSAPAGITCGATCSAGFADGTRVTLSGVPDVGSFFAGFGGAADCADGRVTLTSDLACTATFIAGVPTPTPLPSPGGPGLVDYQPRPLDLNGDGRGDTILYRAATGGAASLLESGSFARVGSPILESSSTHTWSPGWTIKTGDFDGDGRTDLFFYDAMLGNWFEGISTTPAGGPASYSLSGGTWSPDGALPSWT